MKLSRSVSAMALPGWRRGNASRSARPPYSRALLLPCTLLTIAARAPQPRGELVLDAAQPVIAVEIDGVPMRLRVDLDQQESIELNPTAAARLPVKWEKGYDLEVGRVHLPSREAPVRMRIAGRLIPTQVAEHGRDCCAGSDGAIGPDLLPYAIVRWRNASTPSPGTPLTLPIETSSETGLSAPGGAASVRLRFAFALPSSVATAAAGGRLARLWGGSWAAPPGRIPLAFGIARPARDMAFARPGRLAGFRFDRLMVRTGDFEGRETLPEDPALPGELVVRHGLPPQHGWPAVTIGTDKLARCAEVAYRAEPRSLTLDCAFDTP